uniref:Apoptosis-inducing factor B n=2 Tax=Anthurium amnicola TaxID=1678845 RepID=A0A1D1Z243_9ARAE
MEEAGRGRRRLVVVGGGVAGALLAKTMQFDADVYLIDPKEYFEIPWADLRAKVEPSFAERSTINHTDYLTNGRLVTSSAIGVTERDVLTKEGRLIAYDYLVIATGHNNSSPVIRRDRLEQFLQVSQKIKSSNSILIIGGGPTGVELAAEIAVDFPMKKVTLVHSGSRLLQFIGPKASDKAQNWLTSKGVDVILGQFVDMDASSEADKVFKTSAGETVNADCYFDCTGKPVGSSWLRETFLKDCIDKRGRLTVDESLRVTGKRNIFAIGDITDVNEIKQGFLAQRHALVVAKNLKLLMRGTSDARLHKYKPGSVMAIVSLGRKEAVAHFPILTTIGCIPGMIKSKDLFVGKTRKQLGV